MELCGTSCALFCFWCVRFKYQDVGIFWDSGLRKWYAKYKTTINRLGCMSLWRWRAFSHSGEVWVAKRQEVIRVLGDLGESPFCYYVISKVDGGPLKTELPQEGCYTAIIEINRRWWGIRTVLLYLQTAGHIIGLGTNFSFGTFSNNSLSL